jgi:predicted Zn-dependent protease
MIAGLVRMPPYVSAAIHLGRAEKASEARRYITAQKELRPVLAQFPDHLASNAEMLIASAYSFDMSGVQASYAKLENREIKDDELFERMQTAMQFIMQSVPNDTTLPRRVQEAVADSLPGLLAVSASLDSLSPDDSKLGRILIANQLYDLDAFKETERLLQDVLAEEPDNYPALMLMGAVRREQGAFDESLRLYDRILAHNPENVAAIAQKAKTELKRNRDRKAAEYAATAMRLDPTHLGALEAQAMVDYYAGRAGASADGLKTIRGIETSTSDDSIISHRLAALLSGAESYR